LSLYQVAKYSVPKTHLKRSSFGIFHIMYGLYADLIPFVYFVVIALC